MPVPCMLRVTVDLPNEGDGASLVLIRMNLMLAALGLRPRGVELNALDAGAKIDGWDRLGWYPTEETAELLERLAKLIPAGP